MPTQFPLNEIQNAYWVGRTGAFEFGNASTQSYREYDCENINHRQLEKSWQALVDRHEMLRAVVLPNGMQEILDRVPAYRIAAVDLRERPPGSAEAELQTVRDQMNRGTSKTDEWPLFEIRLSIIDNLRSRLHFALDMLIADADSAAILLDEWSQLYRDPETKLSPIGFSFQEYMHLERYSHESSDDERASRYWLSRQDGIPPAPQLPLVTEHQKQTSHSFRYRCRVLDSHSWRNLKKRAGEASLTPSGIALAAYAEVLRVWSGSSHFTLNLPVPFRRAVHPGVNNVVGDFTSILLLEVDHRKAETFRERALQIQEQLRHDKAHSSFNCVNLVRQRIASGGGVGGAAMPVVFTGLPHKRQSVGGEFPQEWPGRLAFRGGQTPMVWLDNILQEVDGALHSHWITVAELFPPGLIDDLCDAYYRVLKALATDSASWTERLPRFHQRLTPQAYGLSLNADPGPPGPSGDLLHTLFIRQAREQPDQIAVKAQSREITYGELYRQATRTARVLCAAGVKRGNLVAVVMYKGWEQVVAVLGILQSGAAYVPIDPGLPTERLWRLLEKTKAFIALTQPGVKDVLSWPEEVSPLCVGRLEQEPFTEPDDQSGATPTDLAYVIYTSGSTGEPKGVMIDHRGAVNTIRDINRRFSVGSRDRVLALSSLSFDLSVYDIFGTLAAGGAIVVPEEGIACDPGRLHQVMTGESVTIWNSVPAVMSLYTEYLEVNHHQLPGSMRLVLLSGDWIAPSLPGRIQALKRDTRIVSLGGATEASIWSVLYEIDGDNTWSKSVPYGRPMHNQHLHVLNASLLPCPVWVAGNLYIGGLGLAQGYWEDEEGSAAGFIINLHTGQRLYRTGDLGRFMPDGNIEFLGREDSQVKVQGFRVELGEIETALSTHPTVRTAVVSAVGDRYADKRLLAHILPEHGRHVDSGELGEYLSAKLPAYLLPSVFIEIDELPLTANGKVDRNALPMPDMSASEISEPGQPDTKMVKRLSYLVAEVMNLHEMDPDVDWLNLGATSVDMVRIGLRVEEKFRRQIAIDELYRKPTVRNLAHTLESLQHCDGQAQIASSSASTSIGEQLVRLYEEILDPEDRKHFRSEQQGLRRPTADQCRVNLETSGEEADRKIRKRRSHRFFSCEPFSLQAFGGFLECLKQGELNGEPKYGYASAGGLYPVRTYLFVKADLIQGLDAGFYYYEPAGHRLVSLSASGAVPEESYDLLTNRPVYQRAAFAIFLIAKMGAIAPMYGDQSHHYVTLEAGAMAHALECSAALYGLGLCQIGSLDFDRFRCLLKLDEDEILIHSLLGGKLAESGQQWTGFHEAATGVFASTVDFEEGDL